MSLSIWLPLLPSRPVIRELFSFERVRFTTTTETSSQRAVADAAVLMALTALASLVVPEAFRVFLTGLGYRDEVGIFVVGGSVATLSLGVLAVVYLRRSIKSRSRFAGRPGGSGVGSWSGRSFPSSCCY